jgi:hypothetical protein
LESNWTRQQTAFGIYNPGRVGGTALGDPTRAVWVVRGLNDFVFTQVQLGSGYGPIDVLASVSSYEQGLALVTLYCGPRFPP